VADRPEAPRLGQTLSAGGLQELRAGSALSDACLARRRAFDRCSSRRCAPGSTGNLMRR